MSLLPGFETEDEPPPQAARLAPRLKALAEQGVYFGASSWKYEGWLGSIYSPEKYLTRGKFSRKKFETECLAEYAATFPVVCGDFTFYQFPSPASWKRLFEETPDSLLFAFKVPEDITVAHWPKHARYGTRAGAHNSSFLNAKLLEKLFTNPLQPYLHRVAALIFEFGAFAKSTFPTPEDFLNAIDPFLAALPNGFRYSIEIRNPEYLGPAYFSLLARHNVAHVLNAWTRMPDLNDQIAMPGAFSANFTVARALLSHGRTYENAVQALEPYQLVRAPDNAARAGLQTLAEHAQRLRKPAFLFVNNRLEGNAPSTIEAVINHLSPDRPPNQPNCLA